MSSATRQGARKRPLDADEPDEVPDDVRAMLDWVREEGGTWDGLRFAPDGYGGTGGFARTARRKGDALAFIPRSCVLTAAKASASSLGKMARAAAARWGVSKYATPECILWIYMCVARVTPSMRWHAYVASLPATCPDPTNWAETERAQFTGTPIGVSIDEARAAIVACHDRFAGLLSAHAPELVPSGALSVEALLWARSMFTSRAFPIDLATDLAAAARAPAPPAPPAPASDDGAPPRPPADEFPAGVMLPMLDLLNHRFATPISWLASASGVAFRTEVAIAPAEQVHNNYGARSNEELLFNYGFAMDENPFDAVTVSVVVGATADAQPRRQRFEIRREEHGGIPTELWRALGRVGEFGEEVAESDPSEEAPIEVGAREVMMLHQTLQRREAALVGSAAEDGRLLAAGTGVAAGSDLARRERAVYGAVYRQGQRAIVAEALEALATMLGDCVDEDDSDDA